MKNVTDFRETVEIGVDLHLWEAPGLIALKA